MLNILSIDLEDYFMVSAFERVVKREDWDKYESRIERNTHRILEILAEAKPCFSGFDSGNPAPCAPRDAPGVKATFFCLGWIADRFPGLIKEIHKEGHEIASHGYDHRQIYRMTPGEFREDIRRTRRALEDIIGGRVMGYRAPSYSIIGRTLWAFEILAEEGYCYDSSIFPIYHDTYGIPGAPRFPFVVFCRRNGRVQLLPLSSCLTEARTLEAQGRGNDFDLLLPHAPPPDLSILEFPLSTIRLFNINFPVSGGGYFRLFPYPIIEKALRQIHREERQPFIFYLHPWEMDSEQPRISGACVKSRVRHYINLKRTEMRLKKLLMDFAFSSFGESLGRYTRRLGTSPGCLAPL
jgi:polysaccharide deacetylase family protein (PEP-CTERM system associated)